MTRPGRDRRAERHAARPGRLRDDTGLRVAVVGGGIAGMAAAVALAERGVTVTLLEREQQLGGRAGSWPLPDGRTMSRGFHAFFRQYYNLRALLRRADPELERLRPVPDYPLLHADGYQDTFEGLPLTPPWNIVGFVLRSKAFGLRELSRVDVRAAWELVAVDFPGTFEKYDGVSAATYLDRLRFPDDARELALEVFSRSFFAHPADFSAGELIAMFHAYFLGSAEGLLFDVPDDDYDTALWAPMGAYLNRLGVRIHCGASVTALDLGGPGVTVRAGEDVTADAVVLATDVDSSQRLLNDAKGFATTTRWSAQLAQLRGAAPFLVTRWWFPTPARPERRAFLGCAGFDLVDNISALERFEAGAARWAAEHHGSVLEAHAYAVDDRLPADEGARRMRAVLDELYPEFRGVTPVAQETLLRKDCPLIGTAPWRDRPTVTTPDDRVALAGDWVRCDYPVALMERAATTGLLAANALLERRGLAGHDVWSVPMRSRYRRSA